MNQASKPIKNYSFDPFGDNDFKQIFIELYAPLCRFALKFVHDPDTAKDIVQDLFVYFWENRDRLSRISSVKMYLFTAVKNRSLNYLQKKYPNIQLHQIDEYDGSFQDFLQPSASELLECKELENILEKALKNLPEKCRIIFTLKRFADMSNKEIAVYLNISVKTVEAQMTIALRKLTTHVNTYWHQSAIILLSFFGMKKNNFSFRG
jgi:RNA polymerase sigma-70 factor, ECF subfamily